MIYFTLRLSLIISLICGISAQTVELCIDPGQKLSWQSVAGALYQPQWSENGTDWFDLGSSVIGDGNSLLSFDNSEGRMYRVLKTVETTTNANILSNGGFEEGSGTTAVSWSTNGNLSRSNQEARNGTFSLHSTIENVGNTPSFAQLTQTTTDNNIVAGENYNLSFWVMGIRNGVSYVQQYQVLWLSADGNTIGSSPLTSYSSTLDTWIQITNSLQAPEGAVNIRLAFTFITGTVSGGLGEAFIDDVSFQGPGALSSETTTLPVNSEQGAEISWQTIAGTPYELFDSESLSDWGDNGEQIIGNGGTFSKIVTLDDPAHFYKVQSTNLTEQFSNIVSLYNTETELDPELQEETETALITYMGDRGRDRHAREDMFQAYDHYLTWYWEERTLSLEIVDRVAKGGSDIVFNYTTQAPLGAPEFRAFFRGINTVAEYDLNLLGELVGPNQYTATINSNVSERRPLVVGDRIEIEISQFLEDATNGRDNYYGTTFLYIVGQGVVPWEGRGELLDSFPMPEEGWLGGLTTLPYQYSDEPDHHFIQTAGNISPVSIQPFMEGRRLHHTDFRDGSHSEPGNPIFAEQVGKLGPQFIARSCVECHVNNGRSLSPDIGEPFTQGVVRVSGDTIGSAHPTLGNILQPNSTGNTGEGSISIESYTTTNGNYGDGTPFSLRKPNFSFGGTTPTHYSVRYSQQLVGLGLLEAIDENTILGLADPEDEDNNGISGRPQIINDPATGEPRLGRFTFKASQARVRDQIANALNHDMGLTTNLFPTLDDGSSTNTPEIDDLELEEMERYISLLGVSARRDLRDAQALQGEELFHSIGCADCHVSTITTGQFHPMSELRNQTIHPFTDLLLHDMGEGLSDTVVEGIASGSEWRTSPLWNIGLTQRVSSGQAYLHDGRARTLAEAILWHGGEGEEAKENFRTLSSNNRDALIKFLESL